MKKLNLISNISIWTLVFCFAIGFDVSPYLRGPSYYAPEWRWEYLFQNTLDRIYLPLLILFCIGVLFYWTEKKKVVIMKKVSFVLIVILVLFYSFQFGVLFFSRSGIGVLIQRIINPEINGYFTAALAIHSVPDFLRHYNSAMLTFVYHAKAHPPGAILLFYYINQLVSVLPAAVEWAAQQVPNRPDVRTLWAVLNATQKAGVFASIVIIPFLSAISIIPLYFTAKVLYGAKTAFRSLFLFILTPSLIFFIPINDAFLHLFSITAFYFFVSGLQRKRRWMLFFSGFFLFLGISFNLSLLPVLVLFFIYFLLVEAANVGHSLSKVIRRGLLFVSGLFLPFIVLYLAYSFNFVQVAMTIMQHVPDVHSRSYTIWIFYNLYDFFIFTGIPVAIIYFSSVKKMIIMLIKKQYKNVDPLLVAFTLMILIINFSGSVRGETGRIWIPYIPFIILIVSHTLTDKLKMSPRTFGIVLLLQAIQILVMQEFWVMLW